MGILATGALRALETDVEWVLSAFLLLFQRNNKRKAISAMSGKAS